MAEKKFRLLASYAHFPDRVGIFHSLNLKNFGHFVEVKWKGPAGDRDSVNHQKARNSNKRGRK